jgi:competence protein ComEA
MPTWSDRIWLQAAVSSSADSRFGRKHNMKHLLISAFLAALVIGANVSLANTNTQQVSKTAAAEASTKLKLNQASAEQLAAVPGLGKVKAQAIVDYVQQHGAMKSEADLTKVKGIGNKLAAKVAEYVSFD